jgi:hypothetical protein
VLIGPDGAATPVFEFGLANSVTATAAAPPRDSDLAETASQDDGGAMAAAALRKHILSGEALAPLDWSKLGFIERYVGSHLTDRERATVEHVCHRRLSWTRAWWIAAAAGIPLLAILLGSL